jgi:hypothetical protein
LGSPSGAQPGGGSPQVWQPQHNPQADTTWNEIIQSMLPAATGGLPYNPAASYAPAFSSAVSNIAGNPFYGQALGGAEGAAGAAGGLAPYYGAAVGAGPGLSAQVGNATNALTSAAPGAAAPMFAAGGGILNTAFDPQQGLYNREAGLAGQNAAAAGAMAGVGNTPYGASLDSNAMNNFNLNWENAQLGREQTGIQGAGTAFGSGIGSLGAGLGGALTGGAGQESLLTNPASTYLGALPGISALSAGPYNAANTQQQNIMSAAGNAVNEGNQSFGLGQNLLGALQSYLGGGQSAALASGQLGLMGQNELNQSMQGIGNLVGMGTSLISPISGLFGGGGGGMGAAGMSSAAPLAMAGS